jgi:hypothetical protein
MLVLTAADVDRAQHGEHEGLHDRDEGAEGVEHDRHPSFVGRKISTTWWSANMLANSRMPSDMGRKTWLKSSTTGISHQVDHGPEELLHIPQPVLAYP